MNNKIFIWTGVFILFAFIAFGQDVTDNKYGKGIGIIAADSSFSMKFSTRFQTLYEGSLNTVSNEWSDKLLVRRARLKFEGFAFSPKLEYKIELGLSNRDHGGETVETNNTSNVILDAVAKWKFAKDWELWFGQTKLPGNRERVISSQKLQFVDRSIVNSRFNIDRDIGVQLRHKDRFGDFILKEQAAISMGEGRNITTSNKGGYDYTFRLEMLPLGDFASKGDYFASDLKREATPKLAFGITYDILDGAARQAGQLGSFMTDLNGDEVTTDLNTLMVDMMFKYNGLQVMAEYADKKNVDGIVAITGPGQTKGFITGTGIVGQAGYLFKNNLELAGRYAKVTPDDLVISGLTESTEYTLGLSKYIVDHSLKIQSDAAIIQSPGKDDVFRFRFQLELAF